MHTNTVVRARINEHIKEEASIVLASMGLTVSDAFRILLTRVARDKKLPFKPLEPNQETIDETAYLLQSPANAKNLAESIQQLKEGKVVKYSVEEWRKKYKRDKNK